MSGPVYTFTPNTPNAADAMNATQPLILANFQAIAEWVDVNHVGFNQENTGKHNVIGMPNQSTPPDTATGEVAMFVQATPDGPNASEIFIEYPGNNSSNSLSPVQISNVTTPAGVGAIGYITQYNAIGGSGFIKFPSGFMLKWIGPQGSFQTGVYPYVYPTTYYNYDTAQDETAPVFVNAPTVIINAASVGGGANNANWFASNSTQTSFTYNTVSGSNALSNVQGISTLSWGF